MFADPRTQQVDPRASLTPDALEEAAFQAVPQVGRRGGSGDALTLVGGGLAAVVLGAVTLFSLSQGRGDQARTEPVAPAAITDRSTPPAALRPDLAPALSASAENPPPSVAVGPAPAPIVEDPNQSRANPMIIDNSAPDAVGVVAAATGSGGGATTVSGTADELFASRLGGSNRVARAERLANPGFTVTQGTMIPAVLETALNSDLPGYARAIVSRDVRSFDGARVLIPRGSRLIGEYKSGLTTGQTRAHVVWTRLVRPDGVSIDLGSPAADEAGQAGLAGRVDRHYAQRYGPAALLSLLSGAASSIGGGSSSTVVVGSTASGAAGQALQTDGQIPPTIRLRQGTPIQVFAARDLDFSAG